MAKSSLPSGAITVYLESNPNPHALKFVANILLTPEGMSFDFPTPESASHAPLARELFTYPFVAHVFYMNNFVTVTKHPYIEWIEVQDTLRTHIRNFISSGESILTAEAFSASDDETDTEIVQKIKDALDAYVRPAVELDGGAIAFHSFHDGVLLVRLQGACRGCPASAYTLQNGVENILKHAVPGAVRTVEAV